MLAVLVAGQEQSEQGGEGLSTALVTTTRVHIRSLAHVLRRLRLTKEANAVVESQKVMVAF